MVLVSETGSAPAIDGVAVRLINTVRMPIHIEGDHGPPVVVSASIGSVLDDGASPDELCGAPTSRSTRQRQEVSTTT